MRNYRNRGVTCRTIMAMHPRNKLELVAGEKGLERRVRWLHYIEEFSHIDCVRSNELIVLHALESKSREDVIRAIRRLHSLNIAGIIVYKTKKHDIFPYAKDIVNLGNELGLCIFIMPFNYLLVDITQAICEAISENKMTQKNVEFFVLSLIHGDITNVNPLLMKEFKRDYFGANACYCVVLDLGHPYDLEHEYRNVVNEACDAIENKASCKILYTTQENQLILLISVEANKHDLRLQCVLESIITIFQEYEIIHHSTIGVSEKCMTLVSLKDAYSHAERLSKMAEFLKRPILYYNNAGIYPLLFEIQDINVIKFVYSEILGELITYDKNNKTNYLATLKSHVENKFNAQLTACVLSIHINTLRYRFSVIQNILGIKINEPDSIFRLTLAFSIEKYLCCINDHDFI